LRIRQYFTVAICISTGTPVSIELSRVIYEAVVFPVECPPMYLSGAVYFVGYAVVIV